MDRNEDKNQTYQIDGSWVNRLDVNGKLLGCMHIQALHSRKKLLEDLAGIHPTALATYLIARDELIDKGLIKDPED